MPQFNQPDHPPEVDLQHIQDWIMGSNPVDDAEAYALVTKTFARYESSQRRKTQEKRWSDNDKLYTGYVPKRNWPNGKPRSAIGIPLAFDQVESMYAIMAGEIFEKRPYWFGVESTERSSPQDAWMARAALAAHLEDFDPKDFTSTKVKMKQSLKEFLQHGNCAAELGWDPQRQRLTFRRVALKDFYPDPDLQDPYLDHSAGVVIRDMMTIEELDNLRSRDRFNIPDKSILYGLAKSSPGASSDNVLRDSMRTRDSDPQADRSLPNPASHKVEVLRFWSRDRLIWVLGRNWVALNTENPFGFIPCAWAPLYTVLNEPWGLSVPDAVEGEQMLVQGLVNARIDELSLNLHPPRIFTRDDLQSNNRSELQWGPGSTMSAGVDPTKIAVLFPQGATQQAFQESQLAESRAERRLGVNQTVQSGTPTPSNANRTATGVQAQMGAVGQRLRTPIENFEDYFLLPLLYKAQSIISRFGTQQSSIGRGPNGENIQVPRAQAGSFVRFKLTAAQSLTSRIQLQQMLAQTNQVMLSAPFQQMLATTGKTIDTDEYVRMFNDAVGTGTQYQLVRPFTQQEQQARNQPSPDVAAELQMKQLELQTRQGIAQMSSQTKLAEAQIDAEAKKEVAEETSAGRIVSSLKGQQAGGDNKDDSK